MAAARRGAACTFKSLGGEISPDRSLRSSRYSGWTHAPIRFSDGVMPPLTFAVQAVSPCLYPWIIRMPSRNSILNAEVFNENEFAFSQSVSDPPFPRLTEWRINSNMIRVCINNRCQGGHHPSVFPDRYRIQKIDGTALCRWLRYPATHYESNPCAEQPLF